jgi:hypothetical protein
VLFLDFLATMKLRPEMKALAFEAIRQEWQKRKAVNDDLLAQARKRVTELLAWKAKIIRAWIEERISKEIYEAQLQTVGKELEAAGLTEGETFADLAEVELLLDFADRMLSDVSIIWGNAAWADKQRIQRTIFPNGLLVSKEGFGTPEGSSLFIQLQQGNWDESSMASLIAASWNPLIDRLKAISSLRDLAVTSPNHSPLTGESPHK